MSYLLRKIIIKKNNYLYNEKFKMVKKEIKEDSRNTSDAYRLEGLISGK